MKTSRQRLPGIVGVITLSMTFLLVGCEPIIDFLPPLPRREVPVDEPQTPGVTAQSPGIAEMEASVRQQINEIRTQKDLNSLRENERLAQVAREYSRLMANENFFSHTSPDGSTPAQRVRSAGISYRVIGENLFMSTNAPQPVPLAVKGWMESPGHRENILRPVFTETGVGVWQDGETYYITQLFMRS